MERSRQTPQTPPPLAPGGRALPTRFRQPLTDYQSQRNNALELLAQNQATMQALVTHLEKLNLWMDIQQSQAVATLDSIVYEHDTIELPTGQSYYSLALKPQSRQMEQIDSVFAAITYPALPNANPITAPTITLDNAYAQLGDTLINLNAILNSSGGTGGAIPTPLGVLLNEGSKRTFNIHATANFPQGAYFSAVLVGRTIPATLGEANV